MSGPRAPMLSGWGRVAVPGRELRSEDLAAVAAGRPLTRGLARSYGDASLPAPGTVEVAGSRLADRMLMFDPAVPALRAEAGPVAPRPPRLALPRGSGCRPCREPLVTLGGMVAADVHGRGHQHDGSFGRHVRSLAMLMASGERVECDRDAIAICPRHDRRQGLTGHILEVELELQPILALDDRRALPLRGPRRPDRGAAAVGDRMALHGGLARHTGDRSPSRTRRRLSRAGRSRTKRRALPAPRRRHRFPFDAPAFFLSRPAVAMFNAALFAISPRRPKRRVVAPETCFHPLDRIEDWNRMYGSRGFTQHQCVLPEEERPGATRRFLEALTRFGGTSFLSVLKDFGEQGEGMISFPRRGITVTVDLPLHPGTADVVTRLNEIVVTEGGRVYLAKDLLTSAADFAQMEPRLAEFLAVRRKWDPDGRIESALSHRLFGKGEIVGT
ncbi:MAG: hypothetical protein R2862_08770 [Thermoanaerobaculia bacterium]